MEGANFAVDLDSVAQSVHSAHRALADLREAYAQPDPDSVGTSKGLAADAALVALTERLADVEGDLDRFLRFGPESVLADPHALQPCRTWCDGNETRSHDHECGRRLPQILATGHRSDFGKRSYSPFGREGNPHVLAMIREPARSAADGDQDWHPGPLIYLEVFQAGESSAVDLVPFEAKILVRQLSNALAALGETT